MPQEKPSAIEFKELKERIEYAVRSLPSENHPSWNEDAVRVDQEHGLIVLCDGVGGHIGGKEAANAAADAIVQAVSAWEELDEDDPDADMLTRSSLRNALSFANSKVVDVGKELLAKASQKDKEKWTAPGTAVVAVKFRELPDGSTRAYVANAGDCRVYILRAKTGELEQVTRDHDLLDDDSFIQAYFHVQLAEGEKETLRKRFDAVQTDSELPEGLERELFKMRNWISSGLGGISKNKIESYVADMLAGDRLIATSDGVHDNLSSQKTGKPNLPSIVEIASAAETPDECAAQLTGQAHDYADSFGYTRPREAYEPYMRAHRDDITAAVADIK